MLRAQSSDVALNRSLNAAAKEDIIEQIQAEESTIFALYERLLDRLRADVKRSLPTAGTADLFATAPAASWSIQPHLGELKKGLKTGAFDFKLKLEGYRRWRFSLFSSLLRSPSTFPV